MAIHQVKIITPTNNAWSQPASMKELYLLFVLFSSLPCLFWCFNCPWRCLQWHKFLVPVRRELCRGLAPSGFWDSWEISWFPSPPTGEFHIGPWSKSIFFLDAVFLISNSAIFHYPQKVFQLFGVFHWSEAVRLYHLLYLQEKGSPNLQISSEVRSDIGVILL